MGAFRSRSRLQDIGEEPDARFTYANERTFLAWSRTSLALVVTGIAATQLLPKLDLEGARRLIGIPLILLGAVLALVSYRHWYANERGHAPQGAAPPVTDDDRAGDRHRDRRGDRHGRGARRVTFAGVDPDDERADGLHTERTELAWTRSGLALLGAFAILARRVWTAGPESEDALAVALLGLATIGWAVGILGWGLTRTSTRRSRGPQPPGAARREPRDGRAGRRRTGHQLREHVSRGMQIDHYLRADLADVPASARELEGLGFDGLYTAEGPHEPFFPLVLAAEHTTRATLFTNIAIAFAAQPDGPRADGRRAPAPRGWALRARGSAHRSGRTSSTGSP